MKTSEFIRQCANGEQTREKNVSSVHFDGKIVYSYGRHYPLLIPVAGKWIVNRQGYSVTTSKHIGLAKAYAAYNIEIPNFGTSSRHDDVVWLIEIARKNLKDAQDEFLRLKRTNTKKAEMILARISDFTNTVNFLQGVILNQI